MTLSKTGRRLKPIFYSGACALIMWAAPAHAQRVSPMSYELAPSGSKSTANLSIENTSKTDMTIEMVANRAIIDETGKETLEPAEDDFLIFPPQMVLAAGKTQTVRVKYVGEPSLDESVPYRVSVRQVPVDTRGTGQSAVGLAVNFNTLAHVVPAGAETDLSIGNIRANAAGGWDLEITNSGTKMARLSRTEWRVESGGESKTFNRQAVAKMTERNIIMPGKTVTLSIPAVEGMQAASATITAKTVM